MEATSREPLSSLVCRRTSGLETHSLAIVTLVLLPVLSYKLVKEATLRTGVVLREGVPLALLASAAQLRYVPDAALIVMLSCSYDIGILRQHQGPLRCARLPDQLWSRLRCQQDALRNQHCQRCPSPTWKHPVWRPRNPRVFEAQDRCDHI
jgi:hypothetical protein